MFAVAGIICPFDPKKSPKNPKYRNFDFDFETRSSSLLGVRLFKGFTNIL
jgi:hypothetical protein